MGRRKIEIKAIQDDRNRSVTFLKRKGGLFKKAHELSVLCSVDVAVIIFGSNKRLYEFSSGNIHETLRRYQYCMPHEHKGPADFTGKRSLDQDDDDDDASGAEDRPRGPSLPPHVQPQPVFASNVSHAPSASPPIATTSLYPRHAATPQPVATASRPPSRDPVRRAGPAPLSVPPPPPPPPHSIAAAARNGYAYPPPAHMYAQVIAHPGPPPPHTHAPHYSYQHQHPPPIHHPPPPLPPPPPPPQHVHMAPGPYLADPTRRQSMPPAFPMHSRPSVPPAEQPCLPPPPPPPAHHQHPPLQTQQPPSKLLQPPQEQHPAGAPPPANSHLSDKSRSIYTPIDDRGSVLANHFRFPPKQDSPKHEPDTAEPDYAPAAPVQPPPRAVPPQRTQSLPAAPPTRASSLSVGAQRPRLKVQIPSENSDNGSTTAGSSPHGATAAVNTTTAATGPPPPKAAGENGSLVLPPPSPSASALLSAGAQGPPNPFARPPPPPPTTTSGTYANNAETPISALPSRFVSEMLPSPSTFFSEWNFPRSGTESMTNMLPSPLAFPTPVMPSGPGFHHLPSTADAQTAGNRNNLAAGAKQEEDRKRKSPGAAPGDSAAAPPDADKRQRIE